MTTHATPFADLPDLDLDAPAFWDDQDDRAEGDQLPERIDGIGHDPRHTRRIERRRHLRALRNQAAIDVIERLPEPGEELLLVMTGQYHGIDLVDAILTLADCPATCCYLATLGTNKANIAAICDHLDAGRIQHLTMLVADVFAVKDVVEFAYLKKMLAQRRQRLVIGRNHAKLALFHFADGRHIVLHGSLNLRRCNSFEQVSISQDVEAYGFFAQFVEDVAVGGITP